MGTNQWVTPHGGKWAVQGEGNARATKLFDTKAEAIDFGRAIAKRQGSELIVQGNNGLIQSKDSYGNDPNPPKDKEH